LVRALIIAALVLLPRIADACPYCAAGDDGTDKTMRLIVLGGLILLPFAVAGVVVFAIRRTMRSVESKPIDPFE
jgi:hypothetical protein